MGEFGFDREANRDVHYLGNSRRAFSGDRFHEGLLGSLYHPRVRSSIRYQAYNIVVLASCFPHSSVFPTFYSSDLDKSLNRTFRFLTH